MVNATIRNVETHLTIKRNNSRVGGDNYFNSMNEEKLKENINRPNVNFKCFNIADTSTAWKVSEYGVFLFLIFLYSDWIQRFTE